MITEKLDEKYLSEFQSTYYFSWEKLNNTYGTIKDQDIKQINVQWTTDPNQSFSIDNSSKEPLLYVNNMSLKNNIEVNLNNLKTYLKSQSVFSDYDYEGSNMNVLLDVLAYNTYLNSFYLNMVAAEGFLDSAQMRSSVVSHAKELNYLPRSSRSSKAVINMSLNANGIVNPLIIPKGTIFSGKNSLVFIVIP